MATLPKLLARVWLPRPGCSHWRSSSMTEVEARNLIEAARGVERRAQETGEIVEIPTEDGGLAFVVSRRSPDPRQPDRTSPGYLIILIADKDAYLRECVADRLRAMVLPGEAGAGKGWEFVDPGAAPVEGAPRRSKRLIAPRSARASRKGLPRVLCVLFLVVATASLGFILGRRGSSGPRELAGGPAAQQKELESDGAKLRSQIAELLPQPAPPAPRPSTRRLPPQPVEPAQLTLRSVRNGKPVDVVASPRSWRALHPPAGKAVDAAQVAALTNSGIIYDVDNGTRVVELGRHVFREGELVMAPDAIVVGIIAGPHKGKVGYVLPGTARDREGKLGPASAGPDGVESTFGTGEGVPGDEPPRKSTGALGDGATD
jgi:hypothetical protein